jgi:ABC-type transport system substrate-binding protein
MLQNAVCDRLYTTTASGKVVPQIATAMPVAGKNAQRPKQWTTYTIELRRKYRFEDGTPVTAYSFAEAFARDANPDMQSPALAELKDVVGVAAVAASEASTVSGVRAVDDTTLEIATMKREPNLAVLLAQPYFCPVLEDTPIAPGGLTIPPSAGPFYVASNGSGRIVLARNRYYAGKRRPRFATITLSTGVGFEACRHEVGQGKVDICLDGLPQHAARVSFPELMGQGWLSRAVGCLAWQPFVRLDLATVCSSGA